MKSRKITETYIFINFRSTVVVCVMHDRYYEYRGGPSGSECKGFKGDRVRLGYINLCTICLSTLSLGLVNINRLSAFNGKAP